MLYNFLLKIYLQYYRDSYTYNSYTILSKERSFHEKELNGMSIIVI